MSQEALLQEPSKFAAAAGRLIERFCMALHRLHSRIRVVVATSGTLRVPVIPLQTLQQPVCKEST